MQSEWQRNSLSLFLCQCVNVVSPTGGSPWGEAQGLDSSHMGHNVTSRKLLRCLSHLYTFVTCFIHECPWMSCHLLDLGHYPLDSSDLLMLTSKTLARLPPFLHKNLCFACRSLLLVAGLLKELKIANAWISEGHREVRDKKHGSSIEAAGLWSAWLSQINCINWMMHDHVRSTIMMLDVGSDSAWFHMIPWSCLWITKSWSAATVLWFAFWGSPHPGNWVASRRPPGIAG